MFGFIGHVFDLIIVQPLFNALLAIYSLIPGMDFGVALIILTVIIRMLLYPLVRKQLHQSRMMRKLQPELKKIKKNSTGDRQADAQAMMELYKKHDASPFSTIGVLLIQLPIFIGLYSVVRIFTEHHNEFQKFTYSVLDNVPSIQHLVAFPDQLNLKLFGIFDLSKTAVSGDIFLFILAGLAAVTQFVISRQLMPREEGPKRTLRSILREAADGKQADQAEINTAMMGNMTRIMPIFMFFIMISLPGALALYYTVSNLVAAGQQSYLLRRDADELAGIADESIKKSNKKQSKTKTDGTVPPAVERAKKAETAHITRIVAKDSKRRK